MYFFKEKVLQVVHVARCLLGLGERVLNELVCLFWGSRCLVPVAISPVSKLLATSGISVCLGSPVNPAPRPGSPVPGCCSRTPLAVHKCPWSH